MLILLSPAKIQNFKPQHVVSEYSLPVFLSNAQLLVNKMKQLSVDELAKLLGVNRELARLNADRFYNWQQPFTPQNAKQTVLVFNGEVFHGLDAGSFSTSDFKYAQSHLRILSGLYGVLRPLDLIQPYRIDVSTKLKTDAGKDLYAFWREKVTQNIIVSAQASGNIIINLMSGEYFKTIDRRKLTARIIDVEFLENKNDTYKPIVIYTKKARGLLARYIIQNEIEYPEDLKGFCDEGYWFNQQLSSENKFVFTRR